MRRKIHNEVLENHLTSDVRLLGLPTDFELELRGYSKSYYGRYYIKEKKIVVYSLDEKGNILPYHELLETVVHEAIHHYQHHHDTNYTRLYGVMHDLNFKVMYERFIDYLQELEVMPSA